MAACRRIVHRAPGIPDSRCGFPGRLAAGIAAAGFRVFRSPSHRLALAFAAGNSLDSDGGAALGRRAGALRLPPAGAGTHLRQYRPGAASGGSSDQSPAPRSADGLRGIRDRADHDFGGVHLGRAIGLRDRHPHFRHRAGTDRKKRGDAFRPVSPDRASPLRRRQQHRRLSAAIEPPQFPRDQYYRAAPARHRSVAELGARFRPEGGAADSRRHRDLSPGASRA